MTLITFIRLSGILMMLAFFIAGGIIMYSCMQKRRIERWHVVLLFFLFIDFTVTAICVATL